MLLQSRIGEIDRGKSGSLGLLIANQNEGTPGLFIRDVVSDGPAAECGVFEPGTKFFLDFV